MSNTEDQWKKAILPVSATIEQAIHNLNEVAVKIVIVADAAGVLQGTVSDGDIRRGLLKGLDLASSIKSIVHREAIVVPPELGRDMVMQLMVANKIQQIPVVDDQQHVVGLHLWDEIAQTPARTNLLIIMAGGRGTRLNPKTEACPKALIPLAGKPMLEHIIDRAKLEGFSNFVLAIHYLGDMVESYFGDGEQLGVRIDYLRERTPLGTAGALGLLSPIPDAPVVVTNCDVISDIHYGEILDFHIRQEAMGTMAVRAHEWQHPFGVVHTEGDEIVGFEEKPITRTHINAGVYALDPKAINLLMRDEHCDMPTLFDRLRSNTERIVAYPVHEAWLDVGHLADLQKANAENLI